MTAPRTVSYGGKTWPVPALARAVGLSPNTLWSRLYRQRLPVGQAVTAPTGSLHRPVAGTRYASRFAARRCPENAHPLVRELYRLIERERVSLSWLAARSGVTRTAIGKWRFTCSPNLVNLEAALNVLGYELVVRRRAEESEAPGAKPRQNGGGKADARDPAAGHSRGSDDDTITRVASTIR